MSKDELECLFGFHTYEDVETNVRLIDANDVPATFKRCKYCGIIYVPGVGEETYDSFEIVCVDGTKSITVEVND